MILSIALFLCGSAFAGGAPPELDWAAGIDDLAAQAQEAGQQTSQDSVAASQESRNKASASVVPLPASSQSLSDKSSLLLSNKYFMRRANSRNRLPKYDPDDDHPFVVIRAGEPLDGPKGLLKRIDDDVKDNGTVIRKGEVITITGIDFDKKKITVDLNGGGPKNKQSDGHPITISGAGNSGVTFRKGSNFKSGEGVTIIFQFDKDVPDMTPQEFQALLEPLLDFNQIKDTLSTNPLDNVPKEYKLDVQIGAVMNGMDPDTAKAAAAMNLPAPSKTDYDPPDCATKDGRPSRCEPGTVIVKLPRAVWLYNLGSSTCEIIFEPVLDPNGKIKRTYGKMQWHVVNVINGTSDSHSCGAAGK